MRISINEMIMIMSNYYNENKDKSYVADCINYLKSYKTDRDYNTVGYMEVMMYSIPYGNLTMDSKEDDFIEICNFIATEILNGKELI